MKDEAIIELFWARSEAAIHEIDRAYGRFCQSIAYSILRVHEDAEETVNDTWLKAWDAIPPERPHHLKGFLGRITRQLSINRLERETAQKRGAGQYALALEELAECIPDQSRSEDLAELTALRDALNRFLRSLPTEPRSVFLRRYWYAQSIAEIAAGCGMSESKVKSMLLRTRNKLRKLLTEEGFAL
jgi:RNA polymerase sigma-70 factor (ECF subfamily)